MLRRCGCLTSSLQAPWRCTMTVHSSCHSCAMCARGAGKRGLVVRNDSYKATGSREWARLVSTAGNLPTWHTHTAKVPERIAHVRVLRGKCLDRAYAQSSHVCRTGDPRKGHHQEYRRHLGAHHGRVWVGRMHSAAGTISRSVSAGTALQSRVTRSALLYTSQQTPAMTGGCVSG